MMKYFPILLCLLSPLYMQFPCPAQEFPPAAPTKPKLKEIPAWLVEFSNLPADTRKQYITTFQRAKLAFNNGQWIDCITLLAQCEIIMRGNPNIWNLRASCLIEQKYFEEAEAEMKKILQVMPKDAVTIMNMSSVHMAFGRYEESLKILLPLRDDLEFQGRQEGLIHVLDFRVLLCYLKLGDKDKARERVAHVSPMDDTPLYFYGRAAFALAEGEPDEAVHQISLATRIFANNKAYVPYQRALELSGLLDAQE